MSDVKRYKMGLNVAEVYAKEIESPSGYWMAYADHASALAEKDREIERLRDSERVYQELVYLLKCLGRSVHPETGEDTTLERVHSLAEFYESKVAALAQHEQKEGM